MKHWVTYPLVHRPYAPELVTGAAVLEFARAAEASSFTAAEPSRQSGRRGQ